MDYYQILGVSRDASEIEIRNAYRKLVKQYHPDKNSSDEAKAVIQKINEAHETLSDPEKRRQYDQPELSYQIVFEEDPIEAHRKEFLRKKRDAEQSQKLELGQFMDRVYQRLRKVNLYVLIPILVFLNIDNYLLPVRIYKEPALDGFQQSMGRRSSELISFMKTENFKMSISNELHANYDYYIKRDTLTIEASWDLNIHKNISITESGVIRNYEVRRTIYSFSIPLILISLLMALATIKLNERSYLSEILICTQFTLILFIIFRILVHMGDLNRF
jgi:curved DNA-binding protein CbpA